MKVPVGNVTVDLIDSDDRVVAHMGDAGGGFEPQTLAAWGRICSGAAGQWVIDVGAYTGVYAISAALLGCKVVAFEPMPKNAARLIANAERNGVFVNVLRVAVSDRIGIADISFNPSVPLTSGASLFPKKTAPEGAASLLQGAAQSASVDREGPAPLDHASSRIASPNKGQAQVAVGTLDSYAFHDVAAIKLDIERAEAKALIGAARLLDRCRPALLVEVLGDYESAAVRFAVPGYQVAEKLDRANWLMVPR